MEGRVAWERFGGDDVEAVVAMMLNREHPDSVRINPSQGDGGVDILDEGAAEGGGDVVYQVKRYYKPLNAGQKKKVEKSLARLLHPTDADPRWADLNVTAWRLVTPWNPTPEAYLWLRGLGKTYNVKVIWDGLTVVDQLAAKYPEVIDFYLNGGRAAIEDAYRKVLEWMSMDKISDADLNSAQVSERLQELLHDLIRDPHYLYEYRFGHGEPPVLVHRPRLMFTSYRVDSASSTWHAVDVLARCATSADERPITLRGHLDVEPGSDFATDMQDFHDFGTPFTSPEDAFTGELDAPGGLGGDIERGTLRTSRPAGADLGENLEMRLQILDLDDDVLADALVDRVDRSSGAAGVRVVLREVDDVFELVHRFNLTQQTTRITFSLLPIVGKPVSVIQPGVRFLSYYTASNRLRISPRHSPPHLGHTDDIAQRPEEEVTRNLERVRAVVDVLTRLQQHTSTVIEVPDLETYAAEQLTSWRFAVEALKGEAVRVTAPDDEVFIVVLDPGSEAPQGSFSVVVPLRIEVGTQVLDLGFVRADLADPELLGQSQTEDGHPAFNVMTPDRTVRYTLESSD